MKEEEIRKYQKIINTVQVYSTLYNYDYNPNESKNFNKRYYYDNLSSNKCKVSINISGSNDLMLYAECFSLTNSILRELGLEVTFSLASNDKLLEYLDYIEIDYEVSDSKDIKIIFNDEVIGIGTIGESSMELSLDILKLIDNMSEVNKEYIDAYIIASSSEEKLRGSMILQDLRLNGLICDADYVNKDKEIQEKDLPNNIKHIIILDDEELKKGLVKVKDNATGEEVNVPEDEIIDYMLGVI